jgi:Asp-tRNA(Asn)/Glu-tRNA(Gln) amidotransferase A subunit family amidase
MSSAWVSFNALKTGLSAPAKSHSISKTDIYTDTSGNNPNYGTPPNPHNPQYYAGGSSSGSAYAVSTGLIPFALGGDGGGSIRVPASFCSVYGLKTTHGRISQAPSANHANTCAVNGPLASDIRTLAAMYYVIGTPHPSSHFPLLSSFALSVSPPTSQQPKILGVPEEWISWSTTETQELCHSLLDKLVTTYDYKLVPIKIPFLVEGQLAHAMTVLTDAATLLPYTTNITAPNKILVALGSVTPSTDYLLAQKLRQLLMQHLSYLWKQYPRMIIVTPTTSCEGWPIRSPTELKYGLSDGDQTLKTMEYVWMANFTGVPALVLPAGFAAAAGAMNKNVPVGVMGMGEWGSEDGLLQWGVDADALNEELLRRPPIWVDVVERAKQEMVQSTNGDIGEEVLVDI